MAAAIRWVGGRTSARVLNSFWMPWRGVQRRNDDAGRVHLVPDEDGTVRLTREAAATMPIRAI